MRKLELPSLVLLCLLFTAAPARAGEVATPAQRAFDRFRALEGTWTGQDLQGQTFLYRYELVAGGTAVQETMLVDGGEHGKHEMTTLYHLDGDHLVLTHYCVVGNQPRMRSVALADSEIRFELVDVTNLTSPTAGHMRRAEFNFSDPDHFESAWTWHENGKDVNTVAVRARRVSGG